MDKDEIAKEIIIYMIQHDKINPVRHNSIQESNESYTEEVCKAFMTVYKTVANAHKSKYETE